MKSILTVLILLLSISCFSQNEIVALIGTCPNGNDRQNGDVFQLRYERIISKNLCAQFGLRYQNELQYRTGILSENSQFIQSTYNSQKIDLSILAIPINRPRFKLKSGVGFDMAKSEYTYASRGIAKETETQNGLIINEYWQYSILQIPDYGVHFIVISSFYFKNNLFISAQLLYDQVFNEEEYSPQILRKSTISFNTGIGFNF